MKLFVSKVNPSIVPFSRLLSWCLEVDQVDSMTCVIRLKRKKGLWEPATQELEERVESLFGPHVRERFLANSWPGTGLTDHPATVFVVSFNETVRNLMIEAQPSLAKWRETSDPPFPEDICLFKEGRNHPTFLSVTHENIGWLISEKDPRFKGITKASIEPSAIHKELMIPKRKYFCKRWENAEATE